MSETRKCIPQNDAWADWSVESCNTVQPSQSVTFIEEWVRIIIGKGNQVLPRKQISTKACQICSHNPQEWMHPVQIHWTSLQFI